MNINGLQIFEIQFFDKTTNKQRKIRKKQELYMFNHHIFYGLFIVFLGFLLFFQGFFKELDFKELEIHRHSLMDHQ